MNKIILAALVALAPMSAHAVDLVGSAKHQFVIPADRDGSKDFASYAPPSILTAYDNNARCVLGHAGKGIVKEIHFAGTTAGNQWFVLYDSASVGSLSAASGSIDTSKLIYRGNNDTTKLDNAVTFTTPLPYSNGLVVCLPGHALGANVSVLFYKQQS